MEDINFEKLKNLVIEEEKNINEKTSCLHQNIILCIIFFEDILIFLNVSYMYWFFIEYFHEFLWFDTHFFDNLIASQL